MKLPPTYYCVLLLRFPDYSSAFSTASSSSMPSSRLNIHNNKLFATNPFKSILSNIQQQGMSSISSDCIGQLQTLTDQLLSSHSVGSWDDIRNQLQSKQTNDELKFRDNLDKGYGKGSPLHKLRLFDESNKEEDVRVTLYRDSASWCPYCHKVWATLEEKRIPYKVEKINMRCYGEKPASFNRLQPSGAIPVAIIDGVTYNQSNDIIFALEDKFLDHKALFPRDDNKQMAKAQELLRLERTLFSAWMYWLTSRDSPRGELRSNFISVLSEVESELLNANGPFFLGDEISLVDMMFVPFLERIVASMLYFKGFEIRVAPGEKTNYPAINRWFDAMETLESYQLTKSDYYTHCWDLPPQLGNCVSEFGSEEFQDAINGKTPGSWHYPLIAHEGEPDWTFCGAGAKREAVERVSANHQAIVKFACRGAGSAGFPRYGAELSDPNAVSNESVQPFVDASLKIILTKLLDGEDCDEAMNNLVTVLKKEDGLDEQVAMSLVYLRDRVGVPRDMRLPAARQFRATLNWAIDKLA